jgi:sugar O-acyltransferase (sialic acid O-acetyltransferase NeuD family)
VTSKPVVIFGTGDFARIAKVYLERDSPYDVVAFSVDEAFRDRDELLGVPVVPAEPLLETHPPGEYAMLVAVGFSGVNKARRAVYERFRALGYEFVSYVSTAAHQVAEVEIGENCFIFEANVLQPFVRVGDNVIMWSGNHIGHDATIGSHCFIASHAVISGNVSVGESCFIGVNATIRDGVTIASDCVIGAGALVMKDTEQGEVYVARRTELFPKKSWELDL